jgi:hypothetical protein
MIIQKTYIQLNENKTLGRPGSPRLILEWQGEPETPPFESYRDELLPPREDDFS